MLVLDRSCFEVVLKLPSSAAVRIAEFAVLFSTFKLRGMHPVCLHADPDQHVCGCAAQARPEVHSGVDGGLGAVRLAGAHDRW